MGLKLSILDQSIGTSGRPQGQAIRDTLALAKLCDELGYARFWVSEHHNHPTILGTAPEILISAIAVTTRRIRVGAAGIMLPHYAPFKVAEQFRVLDALAPGRIDLGLGRAPGSDGRTAFALNPLANERPAQFPSDVRDLMAWVGGEPLPQGHPFASLRAFPEDKTVPEVWMLGSSDYGAQVAAHFGLPYCFAWFFTDGRSGPEALKLYRERYQPSERHPEPHAALCVWAMAADTHEAAEYHYASRAKWQLYRSQGIFGPLDPPDVALAHPYTEAEAAKIEELKRRAFIGTGPEVAARIRDLATEQEVQEIAVVTWATDEAERRRSYEILAGEFGLAGGT